MSGAALPFHQDSAQVHSACNATDKLKELRCEQKCPLQKIDFSRMSSSKWKQTHILKLSNFHAIELVSKCGTIIIINSLPLNGNNIER